MTTPYRSAALKQKADYYVLQMKWGAADDANQLTAALNIAADNGYRPILLSDAGKAYTVILERWIDVPADETSNE